MYPSALIITPDPRPCSVCLPCLCGALPPKNWRNTSSESENPVCPRETVCVVDTVTTLGATFSTTGANVVIIPSRVCCGCCAATGDRVVSTHKTPTPNIAQNFKIPLPIKRCLQNTIGRKIASGSLFELVRRLQSQVHSHALPAYERHADDAECHCSRVSMRRDNPTYNLPMCSLRTAKPALQLRARHWYWARPRGWPETSSLRCRTRRYGDCGTCSSCYSCRSRCRGSRRCSRSSCGRWRWGTA